MRMTLRDFGWTLAVMVIWGLNFPIAKIGIVEFPPIFMIALRFSLVAVLMLPFARLPTGKVGHLVLASITLGGVHFSLMFTGLSRIDASVAALIGPVQVPFTAIIAALFLGEKITWRLAAGFVIAFAGIALIAGEPRAADLFPVLLLLGAALAWAVANIQLKFLANLDPWTLTWWLAVLSAPQLIVISLLLESGHGAALAGAGWRGWGSVVWQAVAIAIVSYAIWYRLLRRYPVNLMMSLTLMTPVFAVIFSVLLLGEQVTLQLVLGGLATLAGVAVIAVRR